jgi:hypothetical protein
MSAACDDTAGRALTAEEANWENILRSPNKWLTLVNYMSDPAQLKPFMARCAAEIVSTVTSPSARIDAVYLITRDPSRFYTLPDNQELLLCLHASGTQFEDWGACAVSTLCH